MKLTSNQWNLKQWLAYFKQRNFKPWIIVHSFDCSRIMLIKTIYKRDGLYLKIHVI